MAMAMAMAFLLLDSNLHCCHRVTALWTSKLGVATLRIILDGAAATSGVVKCYGSIGYSSKPGQKNGEKTI